jgi:hypothetical protein
MAATQRVVLDISGLAHDAVLMALHRHAAPKARLLEPREAHFLVRESDATKTVTVGSVPGIILNVEFHGCQLEIGTDLSPVAISAIAELRKA